MPTEKPNYGPSWMNYAMWHVLMQLEERPRQMSELPRKKRSQISGTVRRMVALGYVIGDMDTKDPWLMLSNEGRAAIARVRALPRLPMYAGGTTPYYRPRSVETEPVPAPAPLLLPAPTPVDECVASVTVTMSVPVTVMVTGHIDAQSLATLVQQQVDKRGVQCFLSGWRINSVLHGETILAAEG